MSEHFGYCNCDACRVKRLEMRELHLLDELKAVRAENQRLRRLVREGRPDSAGGTGLPGESMVG